MRENRLDWLTDLLNYVIKKGLAQVIKDDEKLN